MPLFHYSLRPGGILLLGSSETVGRAQATVRAAEPEVAALPAQRRGADRGAGRLPRPSLPVVAPAAQEPTRAASRRPAPEPAGAGRPAAAAGVLAAGRAGERAGRHRLHQRSHRAIPGARRRQGQLEHPRDGARRRCARSWRGACGRRCADAGRSNCTACGWRTTRGARVDVTVQAARSEPQALQGMVMIVFRDVAALAPSAGAPSRPRDRRRRRSATSCVRAREEIQALRAGDAAPRRRSCRRPTRSCNPPTRSCSPPTRS
ncbi:MAG: hypothetical protein MZW92_65810 [Comamonadaceae bacterium]|nr:hypothetical protein [Comamonadaceae bacterium]